MAASCRLDQRASRAVIKRSPAPVIRLPASVFNRRYTSGSRPRRNTSTRNWHAVATLLTFCPPGPVEARNRSSFASSGIAISGIDTRLAGTLGELRGGVDRWLALAEDDGVFRKIGRARLRERVWPVG